MSDLIKKHNLNLSFSYDDICSFSDLVGQQVVDVFHNESIFQILTKTHLFELNHEQDCCEYVWLSDVVGDIHSMVGNTITLAEESQEDDPDADESATWTFYKLATIKGYVDLTWRGESNGYYSESVFCHKLEVK